jgi:DNA-binding response OmpR family regulator
MSSDEFMTIPRVLLVEDEARTRESIEEGLRLEGWKVTAAADGEEAQRCLDGGRFDLIVLDWMLPRSGGIEILRTLRGRGQTTPVLMLTARGAQLR